MKPDVLGNDHPLEYAVIDGLENGRLETAPIVLGTGSATDAQVLEWLRGHPCPMSPGAARKLQQLDVYRRYLTVVRFSRCPECHEWSPCSVRKDRGC